MEQIEIDLKNELVDKFKKACHVCHHIHQSLLAIPENLKVFTREYRLLLFFTQKGTSGIIDPDNLTRCCELSPAEAAELLKLYNETAFKKLT